MVDQQHPGDFDQLTRKISVERGFGCASYKEKCLKRRIAVRMRARGAHTYEEYARILDNDSAEYDRLLDALTINVTKLFRNWDAYASIAANVVPELWARETNEIRVWSAGCSSGDEPYSLAVLFHRHAAMNGMLAQLSTQYLDRLPEDYLETYREKIRALTAADVLAAARRHFDSANQQIVVVGDREQVLEQAALFGHLEMFDAQGQPIQLVAS